MSTFVLVPGAGGDATYWYRVEPLLRAAGHEVIAVELPNHEGATFADHADAIVDAVGDRREIVMVAQSMGGFAAPLACERLPVTLLVLLNAMIPLPGETAGDWWENTGQPAAKRAKDLRDGRDPDAEFDLDVVFLHDLPPEVHDEVMSHGGSDPAGSLFGTPFPLEVWPDVLTRVVVGRDDRLLPAEFQRLVARERLGLAADEIVGGHLLALSRPAELTAALLGYLDKPSPQKI